MNNTCEKLEKWGCNINDAMNRFLGDEDLYLSCLPTVIEDENFTLLKEAITKQDIEAAFNAAHTLKGVMGNMGLTPLFNIIVEMVEILRKKSMDNVEELYEKLMKAFEEFKTICEN